MSNCDNKEKSLAEVVSGAICGSLMMLCVIVYIILGVTINFWHPGWIIPACGGIACGVISLVVNTIYDIKAIKAKENNKKDAE